MIVLVPAFLSRTGSWEISYEGTLEGREVVFVQVKIPVKAV